jgi:single-strand DNA-binding protein
MDCNNVVVSGRLTRDPEARNTGGENSVTKLGLALNRAWKNSKGETQKEVTFIDVDAWGSTGEVALKYLKKGDCTLVVGRLKQEEWTDKEGNKKSAIKIVADRLSLPTKVKQQDDPVDGSEPKQEDEPKAKSAVGGRKPAPF